MSSRSMATLAVALVAIFSLLATFIWLRKISAETADMKAEIQQREVQRAVTVLDDRLLAEAMAIDRTASVLAEDSRIKAGLATQAFDGATLSDMLNEIRERSTFDWLALADAQGKVEALSGLEALKAFQGADLGPTPLIVQATAKESAVGRTLWFSGGQAVAVACTGVWRAGRVIGFVLLGKAIDRQQLAKSEMTLGAAIGLTAVKGDLIASSDAAIEALTAAARLTDDGPTLSTVGGASYRLIKLQTSAWANGVVVAAQASSDLSFGYVRHLWLPVVFVGVLVVTILTYLAGTKSHGKR